MREFELIIDEALVKGLKPRVNYPRNAQILDECFGFRCGQFALEPYNLASNPLPETVDIYYNWPYPQVIRGERYTIVVVRDHVHVEDTVYIASDSYDLTEIFGIDELTFGQGTLMELADFGEYAFMTNGVIMIYWDTTISDWHEITSHASIPMMRTICNFKGQAVGGCVLSDWYDCDETFFVWSKIGEMNFVPELKNEAGYRRDPYGGEVYHVRRLGNDVIGYTSKGITKLVPVSSPAATFGFEEIHDVGLMNRGAVAGNEREHCFLDSNSELWKISNKLEKLGYQSYMQRLVNGDVIINYDSSNGDYYISDGITSFLLSPFGLTEIPQHMSAVWHDRGDIHGLPDTVTGICNTELYEPMIVTGPFDFGYRGTKTIFGLEYAGISTDPRMTVDWRMKQSDEFKRANWTPINDHGFGTLIAASNEFRICFKAESAQAVDWIKARYKMTDLRNVRGVYAAPPRGQ